MTIYDHIVAVFKAWASDHDPTCNALRIDHFAKLIIANGWSYDLVATVPKKISPMPNNPWGQIGLCPQQQIELLYYNGLVVGFGLSSTQPEKFYDFVLDEIRNYVASVWNKMIEIERVCPPLNHPKYPRLKLV